MISLNIETDNMEGRPGMEGWEDTFTKRWDDN
jgi:hypothetical protein